MLKVLYTVFQRPIYTLSAFLVALVVFAFATWLPNTQLIIHIVPDHTISFSDKVSLLGSLLWSIQTNFTNASASYTIAIAVLFGVNIALLVYYIRRMRGGLKGAQSTGAIGLGGLVSGIFGIGCAACGSFILTSVLALISAGGAITLLPFGGKKFGFLGVGLLLYSAYALTKKINNPLVCEIT